VKLIRVSKNQLLFHLGQRDRRLLFEVLKHYPCIPPAAQSLTKGGALPDAMENQRLLDEALAEQRAENQARVRALLADSHRWKGSAAGCQLSLTPTEAEWLLEVLNDVRVGSWLRLGSPEEKLQALNARTAPHYWAMEMAGYFEMRLLEGLAK
jgi:hypothetical protein